MEPIRGKNEITDPSYRYKMEKILFQKERTKTCITNLPKIAAALKIHSHDLITTYFKRRLSISIVERNDKIIITNDVDKQSVQNALYEFIEYFVLCKRCHFPELSYFLEKKLNTKCKSCGHITTIEENQNTEKVIKLFETYLNYTDTKNNSEIKTEQSNQIKKLDQLLNFDESDNSNDSNED